MKQSIHHRLVALGTAAALLLAPTLGRAAEACYKAQDSEGKFAGLEATAPVSAEMQASFVEAMNKDQVQRARLRCFQKALLRETDRTKQHQTLDLGISVNPDGSVGRVSVVKSDFNDAMLMSCLGEMVCNFKLQASGSEQRFVRHFGLGYSSRTPEKLDDFRDGRKL